jgi:hypothetical protein
MTTRVFRLFTVAVAFTSVALIGCGSPEKPVAVAATEAKSMPAAAGSGEVSGATCADGDIACEERLYQLEETLFAYEAGAAKQIHEGAQSCWKSDSDAFRRLVDGCNSVACKEKALLTRIASLHLLQPQEQRASLELPQAPLLLAVLAPDTAVDTPAGPPDSTLEFEVHGSLIHAREHPEHMGIAVSADGKDHVFLYDMDIGNQPGQDEVLGLVGTSPTSQVLVRGYRRVAPTGIANFDPSQCRWVYELARD